MTRLLLALAVVAVALGAAGCGSKKSARSTTTTTTTTTTATQTSTSSSSSSSSAAASSFGSVTNCRHLEQLGAKVAQAITANGSNTNSQAVAKAYSDLANAAPAAIRGDLKTLSGALKTYAAALAKSGYKAGSTPTAAQIASLQNAAKSFTDPKLTAAEQHLTGWVTSNCASK
jgi:hypothetical protein